jgi:hypothetical protein
LEVLAEELIATATVEASAAELRVIGNNTISKLKALDLGAEGSHNTNDLVARDERELGNELALVDVKVGTADTACLDLDLCFNCWLAGCLERFLLSFDVDKGGARIYQNIVLTQLRQRDLNQAVLLGLRVLEGPHGGGESDSHCECWNVGILTTILVMDSMGTNSIQHTWASKSEKGLS